MRPMPGREYLGQSLRSRPTSGASRLPPAMRPRCKRGTRPGTTCCTSGAIRSGGWTGPTEVDESFALGPVFCAAYRLLAGAPPDSPEIAADLDRADRRARAEREVGHAAAAAAFAAGRVHRGGAEVGSPGPGDPGIWPRSDWPTTFICTSATTAASCGLRLMRSGRGRPTTRAGGSCRASTPSPWRSRVATPRPRSSAGRPWSTTRSTCGPSTRWPTSTRAPATRPRPSACCGAGRRSGASSTPSPSTSGGTWPCG